jgi:hypothetical protein
MPLLIPQRSIKPFDRTQRRKRAMADLYVDENIHFGIVKRLRRLGHDAVTVQESGRA